MPLSKLLYDPRRRKKIDALLSAGDSLSQVKFSFFLRLWTPMAVLPPLFAPRPSRRKLSRRSRTLLLVFSTSPAPVSGRARHGLSTLKHCNYLSEVFPAFSPFPQFAKSRERPRAKAEGAVRDTRILLGDKNSHSFYLGQCKINRKVHSCEVVRIS